VRGVGGYYKGAGWLIGRKVFTPRDQLGLKMGKKATHLGEPAKKALNDRRGERRLHNRDEVSQSIITIEKCKLESPKDDLCHKRNIER